MSSVSKAVYTTVVLGIAAYPSPLTVTATGMVAPAAVDAIGVISSVAGNSLTNFGLIDGGVGASGIGGTGVDLTAAGTVMNYGSVSGGSSGCTGGTGVDLPAGTLTNERWGRN